MQTLLPGAILENGGSSSKKGKEKEIVADEEDDIEELETQPTQGSGKT